MRVIDTATMKIIYCGKEWPYETDPCSKDMVSHLERNESVVSWLEPINGGPEQQIPCIMVGNQFCPLSLRMMKAIWRLETFLHKRYAYVCVCVYFVCVFAV